MAPARLIALGAVARPHGVRGEVRVVRFNPSSWLLAERDALWLRRGEDARRVKVQTARPHGELVVIKLAGVDDREAADALRGAELCLPREELPPLEDGEVYHVDLAGLPVRREDGTIVGEVRDVVSYPTVDCLLVRGADGVREVPFVAPYVIRIEPDTIVVAHLDDLEVKP